MRIYAFGAPNAPLSQKTFFKADKVDLRWNRAGTVPGRARARARMRPAAPADPVRAAANPVGMI